MATEKQIAANRRNAQLSTGPLSPDGKAMSRRNGLMNQIRFLDEAQAAEFDALHRTLRNEYRPFGAVEAELVEYIAGYFWRRRRPTSLETALFDKASARADDIARVLPAAAIEPDRLYGQGLTHAFTWANNTGADFGKLARYLAVIDGSMHRNLETLARLQARRRSRPAEDTGLTEASKGPAAGAAPWPDDP